MMAIAFLLMFVVTSTVADAATSVVVIGGQKLEPPLATTAVGQPLAFVNRSGARVDIDFLGSSEQHRIAQANGSIVAVILDPGRHPFIVRFSNDRRHHLHGVIETRDAPSTCDAPRASEGFPVCGQVPPGETCIEE